MATKPQVVPGMARAIQDRMDELGLDATGLTAASGKAPPTIRQLRRGERRNYDRATRLAVCAALGWTPDSIDRLLDGGPPVVAGEAEAPPTIDAKTLAEIAGSVAASNAAMLRGLQARLEDVMGEVQTVRAEMLEELRALRLDLLGHERRAPAVESVADSAR